MARVMSFTEATLAFHKHTNTCLPIGCKAFETEQGVYFMPQNASDVYECLIILDWFSDSPAVFANELKRELAEFVGDRYKMRCDETIIKEYSSMRRMRIHTIDKFAFEINESTNPILKDVSLVESFKGWGILFWY